MDGRRELGLRPASEPPLVPPTPRRSFLKGLFAGVGSFLSLGPLGMPTGSTKPRLTRRPPLYGWRWSEVPIPPELQEGTEAMVRHIENLGYSLEVTSLRVTKTGETSTTRPDYSLVVANSTVVHPSRAAMMAFSSPERFFVDGAVGYWDDDLPVGLDVYAWRDGTIATDALLLSHVPGEVRSLLDGPSERSDAFEDVLVQMQRFSGYYPLGEKIPKAHRCCDCAEYFLAEVDDGCEQVRGAACTLICQSNFLCSIACSNVSNCETCCHATICNICYELLEECEPWQCDVCECHCCDPLHCA